MRLQSPQSKCGRVCAYMWASGLYALVAPVGNAYTRIQKTVGQKAKKKTQLGDYTIY